MPLRRCTQQGLDPRRKSTVSPLAIELPGHAQLSRAAAAAAAVGYFHLALPVACAWRMAFKEPFL